MVISLLLHSTLKNLLSYSYRVFSKMNFYSATLNFLPFFTQALQHFKIIYGHDHQYYHPNIHKYHIA